MQSSWGPQAHKPDYLKNRIKRGHNERRLLHSTQVPLQSSVSRELPKPETLKPKPKTLKPKPKSALNHGLQSQGQSKMCSSRRIPFRIGTRVSRNRKETRSYSPGSLKNMKPKERPEIVASLLWKGPTQAFYSKHSHRMDELFVASVWVQTTLRKPEESLQNPKQNKVGPL